MARTVSRSGTVYFADLAGASAGCLLLIPLLNWMGGPNTLLFAAGVWAASAGVWAALGGENWRRWMVLPLLFAVAITANAHFRFLDIKFAKGRFLGQELYSGWNSFSYVRLTQDGDETLDSH